MILKNIQDEIDESGDELAQQEIARTEILTIFLESNGGIFELDRFIDFANDHVKNEAVVVKSFDAIGAYDEPFDVKVLEYKGIFFVQANEFDDIGFFFSQREAEDAAEDLASYYQ